MGFGSAQLSKLDKRLCLAEFSRQQRRTEAAFVANRVTVRKAYPRKRIKVFIPKSLILLVGDTGFEPVTPAV